MIKHQEIFSNSEFSNSKFSNSESLNSEFSNSKSSLQKVHTKLSDHIGFAKGHLFTMDRPTLTCNKSLLIDMMDSMLAELEALENQTINRVSVVHIGQSRSFQPHRENYSMRQNMRPFYNSGRSNFRKP